MLRMCKICYFALFQNYNILFLDSICIKVMILFDMSDSFQKEHGFSRDPGIQYERLLQCLLSKTVSYFLHMHVHNRRQCGMYYAGA